MSGSHINPGLAAADWLIRSFGAPLLMAGGVREPARRLAVADLHSPGAIDAAQVAATDAQRVIDQAWSRTARGYHPAVFDGVCAAASTRLRQRGMAAVRDERLLTMLVAPVDGAIEAVVTDAVSAAWSAAIGITILTPVDAQGRSALGVAAEAARSKRSFDARYFAAADAASRVLTLTDAEFPWPPLPVRPTRPVARRRVLDHISRPVACRRSVPDPQSPA